MIGFKGKRYYLGTFENYVDAVRARLDAEEMIHGGFLRDYHQWKAHADADAKWGEEHPLVFEIEKKGGHLTVKSE